MANLTMGVQYSVPSTQTLPGITYALGGGVTAPPVVLNAYASREALLAAMLTAQGNAQAGQPGTPQVRCGAVVWLDSPHGDVPRVLLGMDAVDAQNETTGTCIEDLYVARPSTRDGAVTGYQLERVARLSWAFDNTNAPGVPSGRGELCVQAMTVTVDANDVLPSRTGGVAITKADTDAGASVHVLDPGPAVALVRIIAIPSACISAAHPVHQFFGP